MGNQMITRSKTKYVLAVTLLITLAGGLYSFIRLENHSNRNAEIFKSGFVNEITGVTHEASIPILLYHGIVEEDDGSNVTIANFRDQMIALKENGYTTVDTHDLLAFYEDGAYFPEKSVMITFDDGRRDSYFNSEPILEELGFKAVMFVVSEKQENEEHGFLSWDELLNMQQTGRWDIEAHGYHYHEFIEIDGDRNMGNYASNKMWLSGEDRLETDEEYKQRLSNDLQEVRNDLESHIGGLDVIAFAFPFGDYGQQSINVERGLAIGANIDAVKAVYPLSFELNCSLLDRTNFDDSDHNLLRRFEVHSNLSTDVFIKTLEGFALKKLPYAIPEFNSEEIYSWFSDWGQISTDTESVKLKANKEEFGAMAILYGGHYWKNYSAQTELSIEDGSYGYLIGRYVDNKNYVSCEIDGATVSLKETVGGNAILLGSIIYKKQTGDYKIELEFSDDTVSCKVDDQITLGPLAIDPVLNRGGVGFKAWDPRAGLAGIAAYKLEIIPKQASQNAQSHAEMSH